MIDTNFASLEFLSAVILAMNACCVSYSLEFVTVLELSGLKAYHFPFGGAFQGHLHQSIGALRATMSVLPAVETFT